MGVREDKTEATLLESGSSLPFTFFGMAGTRNHTGSQAAAVERGAVLGAAHDGRFATATRADYAAAAVAVLTGGHENKVYELGGDEPYTLTELVAEAARQTNKPLLYKALSQEEYAKALAGLGVPEGLAHAIANADAGASRGELYTSSHDLLRSGVTLRHAVRCEFLARLTVGALEQRTCSARSIRSHSTP